MKIGALILAAGGSARLGRPKQLACVGGKSLIRRTVEAATCAACSPIVVVLGGYAQATRTALQGEPVALIENEVWRSGIGTSIRAGVRRLKADPALEAIVILVCDQPRLEAGVIRGLREVYRAGRHPIVASVYEQTVGVPALFDRSYFEELLGLQDDQGAKALMKANKHLVGHCEFPGGQIDIDTPEDLATYSGSDSDWPQGYRQLLLK